MTARSGEAAPPEAVSRVLLVGMMGAGKTTVGHALALRLGWRYLDSDAEVEKETGRDVPTILAEDGEAAFREAETAVLRHALAEEVPEVVSVAGGAVLKEDNRRLLKASGTVVWLRAAVPTLTERVGAGHGRPLLGDHPGEALARLYETRRPLYHELADLVIDVDGLTPAQVTDRIVTECRLSSVAASSGLTTVPVALAERSYEVVVGPGALGVLSAALEGAFGRHLPGQAPAPHKAVIVTQAALAEQAWFDQIDPGFPTSVQLVADGEEAKSVGGVEDLWRAFVKAGLSRRDLVVAVGGGVVSDLAGFAAATYLRGVRCLNVATTLLGQVDAAIGGKTGVNLPEGKNLVGAFWQPLAVVCDTEVLDTLPEREWRSGRGEMAKYALLFPPAERRSFLSAPFADQVTRCVAYKAEVVGADEREGDRRALLNYGHTLAHALEGLALARPGGRDLTHGEAVAVGLLFAARLARRLGRVDDEAVAVHRRVVEAFGLSGELPPGLDPHEVLSFMARDKKAHHDLTFVLQGEGGIEVVHHIAPDDVLATLAEMGATTGTAATTP